MKISKTMKDKAFKETCIWMSYRYAIGRHTIASTTHASDIFDHIDWIPEGRRDFFAEDIYREINSRNLCYKNVHLSNYLNSDAIDVFSVLFKFLYEHPDFCDINVFNEYDWYVDCTNRTVDYSKRIQLIDTYNTIFSDYHDFEYWIKLAQVLNNDTYLVTYTFEDKKETVQCIRWWQCDIKNNKITIDKVYSKKYNDENKLVWPSWYIDYHYINKIEKM